MAVQTGAPAASYKFNSFQEIKSHSSILYNERMAILFYLLQTVLYTVITFMIITDNKINKNI